MAAKVMVSVVVATVAMVLRGRHGWRGKEASNSG